MLILCPMCGSNYGPGSRYCPRCDRFETPIEQRLEFLANKAESMLDAGSSAESITSFLTSEGVPDYDVHEILSTRRSKVLREARSMGLRRIGVGAPCILLAIGMMLSGIPFVMVFFLFALGVSLAGQGLRTVIDGREG